MINKHNYFGPEMAGGLILLGFLYFTMLPHSIVAQAATEAEEIVSEEGGFKIIFPLKPTKTVSETGSSFGKITSTDYQAKSSSIFYGVNYFDLPFSTGTTEIKSLYDGERDRIQEALATSGGKLVEEKDFYSGKRLGREIMVERGNSTSIIRFLFVAPRWFKLMVGTPRRFTASSSAELNSFRKTADQFFDSFMMTKVPSVPKSVSRRPADFGLKIENGVLSSASLGLTINLPSGLRIPSSAESKLINGLSEKMTDEKLQSPAASTSSNETHKSLVRLIKNLSGGTPQRWKPR